MNKNKITSWHTTIQPKTIIIVAKEFNKIAYDLTKSK